MHHLFIVASNNSLHSQMSSNFFLFVLFRTDTQSHLNNHVAVKHSTDKPFKCTQCTYEAARKNYLTDHIRSVHEKIKKFKCDFCSYQTTSNSSLTKHVCSVHNQQKPFTCDQCPFQGTTKMSMVKHVNEAHPATTVVQEATEATVVEEGATTLLQHDYSNTLGNIQVIKVINIVPTQ